jgi:hypothetical protein
VHSFRSLTIISQLLAFILVSLPMSVAAVVISADLEIRLEKD